MRDGMAVEWLGEPVDSFWMRCCSLVSGFRSPVMMMFLVARTHDATSLGK